MNQIAESGTVAWVAAIEARARAANSVAELGFSMANDCYELLAFRQALVFTGDGADGELMTVSGLVRPTEDSPYLVWLKSAWPWLQRHWAAQPGWLAAPTEDAALPPGLLDGWHEWWPQGVFGLALRCRTGEVLGWLCFLLEHPPTEAQVQALQQLAQTWSYCWEMLAGKPKSSLKSRWRRAMHGRRRWLLLAFLLLLVPVRQTALAPAEVIALDARAVSAPLDGVIKTIHVRPNSAIKAGQLLFSLDETTLKSRLEVAQQSVAVADAELMVATQKAFDSLQSKGELAMLGGRAHERRAELAAVQTQLSRIDVAATHDGVAVFSDPDDWLGRPVTTGERIMLLANPNKPGVLVHLPVADAIALETGAAMKVFLTVKPLSPMDARITETSYQSVLSPENVASYRLRGSFNNEEKDARIGLRGTAKVIGDWVPLGYYLFRRPLATLREWSGW